MNFKVWKELFIVVLVGVIAASIPYGFASGIGVGVILARVLAKIEELIRIKRYSLNVHKIK